MQCACGCGREIPPKRLAWALPHANGHPIYASEGCRRHARERRRAKLKKRRQRGGLVSPTTVICVVCNTPLKRGPKQQRKRYHDHCKDLPIKIQDFLREDRRKPTKRKRQPQAGE